MSGRNTPVSPDRESRERNRSMSPPSELGIAPREGNSGALNSFSRPSLKSVTHVGVNGKNTIGVCRIGNAETILGKNARGGSDWCWV